MRQLVISMHMSLDGYVAAADTNAQWAVETGGFETVFPKLTNSADTLLLGRPISRELLGYWLAAADDPKLSQGEANYAKWVTKAHKVIFSNADEQLEWEDAELRVIKNDADMVEAVTDLKNRPGANIVVHGGVRTARNLARLGLVDEYQLIVQPSVLGEGESIFNTIRGTIRLNLIEVQQLNNGALFLRYQRVK